MKRIHHPLFLISACLLTTLTMPCIAAINQVRVVNESTEPVYLHLGGYANSEKINPGKWKIFPYPFKVIPPGSTAPVRTSLLVATAGGQWVTAPDGTTSLNKPSMELCLDYNSSDLVQKSGNRKWTIKQIGGFDQGCHIKPYKQPWAPK